MRFADYRLAPKRVKMGSALHEGTYYGLANQLLMLDACVLIVVLAMSGAAACASS
jgi:uncharacterized iron-regulated membrane protein